MNSGLLNSSWCVTSRMNTEDQYWLNMPECFSDLNCPSPAVTALIYQLSLTTPALIHCPAYIVLLVTMEVQFSPASLQSDSHFGPWQLTCTPPSPTLWCVDPASGWIPYGAAVPVPGLAHVPRHSHIQTLLPQAYSTGGQVAGRIWWGRGTHCGPLSVSYRSPKHRVQLILRNKTSPPTGCMAVLQFHHWPETVLLF